jgi:hypothetical protein
MVCHQARWCQTRTEGDHPRAGEQLLISVRRAILTLRLVGMSMVIAGDEGMLVIETAILPRRL